MWKWKMKRFEIEDEMIGRSLGTEIKTNGAGLRREQRNRYMNEFKSSTIAAGSAWRNKGSRWFIKHGIFEKQIKMCEEKLERKS